MTPRVIAFLRVSWATFPTQVNLIRSRSPTSPEGRFRSDLATTVGVAELIAHSTNLPDPLTEVLASLPLESAEQAVAAGYRQVMDCR